MRVLFIDDQPEAVENAVEHLRELGHECEVAGFNELGPALFAHAPHVVVLDLALGAGLGEGELPGIERLRWIWDQYLCPVVIYTGFKEAVEGDERLTHPLLKLESKGPDSELRIGEWMADRQAAYETLYQTRCALNSELRRAIEHVTTSVHANADATVDGQQANGVSMMARLTRRRLAAFLDTPLDQGVMECWEQYIVPPVSNSLMLGDLLLAAAGPAMQPSSYRVVLTPSCDLVRYPSKGNRAKVAQVLLARCVAVDEALKVINMADLTRESLQGQLPSILSQGYRGPCMFLPALANLLPEMAFNLRELELVNLNDITTGEEELPYRRVAAVDSPFRELVSWALMQQYGRPGLPNRDFKNWARDIAAAKFGAEG